MSALGTLGNLGKVYQGFQNTEMTSEDLRAKRAAAAQAQAVQTARAQAAAGLFGQSPPDLGASLAGIDRGVQALTPPGTATPVQAPPPGTASISSPSNQQTDGTPSPAVAGALQNIQASGGMPGAGEQGTPGSFRGGNVPGNMPVSAGPPPPVQSPPTGQPGPTAPTQPQGAQGGIDISKIPPSSLTTGQLAEVIRRNNPKVNWSTPQGMLQLFSAVEAAQHLLEPEAKQQLAKAKTALTEHQAALAGRKQDEIERHNQANEDLGGKRLDAQSKRDDQRNNALIATINARQSNSDARVTASLLREADKAGFVVTDDMTPGDIHRGIANANAKKGTDKSRSDLVKEASKVGVKVTDTMENADISAAIADKNAAKSDDKSMASLRTLAAKNGVPLDEKDTPQTSQKKVAEAMVAKANSAKMTPENIAFVGEVAKTDPSILSHAVKGRGDVAAANMNGILEWMQKNGTPEQVAQAKVALAGAQQEARAIANIAGPTAVGAKEIEEFAPLVLEGAKKIDSSKFPTVQSLLNYAAAKKGDPAIIKYGNNIQALKSAAALVLTRGGRSSDEARRKVDEIINKDMGVNQIPAAIEALRAEAAGTGKASKAATADVVGGIGAKPPVAGAGATSPDDPLGILK